MTIRLNTPQGYNNYNKKIHGELNMSAKEISRRNFIRNSIATTAGLAL